jgi:hypothetical protein
MFDLIKQLFEICQFKEGPQDLPPQTFLLGLLLVGNILISFLMLNMGHDVLRSLFQASIGIALDLSFCALCLIGIGKLARFNQTASAMLGTDALISFIALPVMATLQLGQGGIAAFLLMLALIIWHWAVIGHIMRHALNQHLSFGLGLALLYLLASYQVMALLFPEVPEIK